MGVFSGAIFFPMSQRFWANTKCGDSAAEEKARWYEVWVSTHFWGSLCP